MNAKPHKLGHGEKFSRKKEQAVLALLTCASLGEAAKQVGIGESTLWRWMQDEQFNEMYRLAKQQAVGQAIARLQQATTMAVDTLCDVMQNQDAPQMARVLASKTVLDSALKAVEVEDLAARIDKLERMMKREKH